MNQRSEQPTEFQAYAIGDGWLPLAVALATICEANGGTVVQVKEKFGSLRFYYDRPNDVVLGEASPVVMEFWEQFDKTVRAVEALSSRTCEITGKPGSLHARGYWVRTVSPEYAAEHGYRRVRMEPTGPEEVEDEQH